MVKLFVAISLTMALGCHGQSIKSADFVRFDHIGESDKPIRSIVLSDGEIPTARNQVVFAISRDLLMSVNEYAIAQNTGLSRTEATEFGIFMITSYINGKEIKYVLSSRKPAINYFKDLRNKIKDASPDKLLIELDTLLRRITF